MANPQPDRVRERAYHLWQESGGQPGREMDHWLQAEREVGAGDASAPPKKAKAAAAAPKAAKSSAKASEAAPAPKPKVARTPKPKA